MEGTRGVPTWYNIDAFLWFGDRTEYRKTLGILYCKLSKECGSFGLSGTSAIVSITETGASCVQSLGDSERKG